MEATWSPLLPRVSLSYPASRGRGERSTQTTPLPYTHQVGSYLNFFHHLLAKRADLSRAHNNHVLWALILAGDPIEGAALVVNVAIEAWDRGRHGCLQVCP